MFNLSYEPDRVLLKVVYEGYWTPEIFRDFERDFLAHHNRIRTQHENYRVIADCRNFPVQSAETGDAFAAFYKQILDENKGHYAIVTPSMLNKIQAKRALPQPNVQVFADMDEAMAWLFEDGSLPD